MFPSYLWQAILRCSGPMWNLSGEVLNDQVTSCVFVRNYGQLVNKLFCEDFLLKYLLLFFSRIPNSSYFSCSSYLYLLSHSY